MRRIFARRAVGLTYTGPSIPGVPLSTSCYRRCAMLQRPNACSAKLFAIHHTRNPASSTPIRPVSTARQLQE